MRLITVAHGTRTPRGNDVARRVTAAAARRLGIPGVASFVELCEPLFADVVAQSPHPSVAVPLLLSTGVHVRTDLPAMARGATGPLALGGPLGPHRLLAMAQVARLLEAGARPGGRAVMVAAGSTDPAAMKDLHLAARFLAREWGGGVEVATLSGRGARPADVVRAGDVVAPYLLAPGHFADRLREESYAAGAAHVGEVIGAHEHVVDLVVQRARTAASAVAGSPTLASCTI